MRIRSCQGLTLADVLLIAEFNQEDVMAAPKVVPISAEPHFADYAELGPFERISGAELLELADRHAESLKYRPSLKPSPEIKTGVGPVIGAICLWLGVMLAIGLAGYTVLALFVDLLRYLGVNLAILPKPWEF